MKITRVRAIPMSDPVPVERQHRTDLGTKVKSDATLILVETDKGLRGMGAALGAPPVVQAIVEHELAAEVVGEDPLFSERIYEKMYNGSRAQPALERGVPQPEVSRRSGLAMEAIAGVDRKKTVVTSPFLVIFTYTLDDAYTVLVEHSKRHIRQAKRVMEADGFPASAESANA